MIAIPKTMDNDVHGTDYCIGFSTAVTRGVQFIHNLRTSTGSHERIAVVELFGRYSGETSLDHRVPRGRRPRGHLRRCRSTSTGWAALLVADKRANPSNYSMVTVSEGATIAGGEMVLSGEEDAYGHRKLGGIGELTAALLKERTGEEMIVQEVGYLMRSGAPDSLDLMVATNYAVMAADLALEGASGRLDGRAAQRDVHGGPDLGDARGRQARRRRRALRRRRLPAQGAPRRRQADVPVLRGGGPRQLPFERDSEAESRRWIPAFGRGTPLKAPASRSQLRRRSRRPSLAPPCALDGHTMCA